MESQVKVDPARVRALREAKSWSQEHLASASGLSTRTVQRVEAEGASSAETLLALASALGVGVADLRPGATDPEGFTRGLRWGRIGWASGVGCGALGIGAGFASGTLSAGDAGVASALLGVLAGLVAAAMGLLVAWARTRATTA
jgi:DNA-binding XRE family transcriptional regulator